ncbi:MAG: phospholipid carrier-dependent glycosyltransferase [Proteobacteria bacterium]|nr:phospholipid carrier-dependent glycosyltransferase [Pseudomonadota bacterium]
MIVLGGSASNRVIAAVEIAVCVIVLALVVLLVGEMAYASSFSVDSLDVMRVFSDDETVAVSRLMKNLHEGDLDPRGFYNYGYVYNSLGFLALKLTSSLGLAGISVPSVAICLRLISIAAFAMCGVILFLTVKELGMRKHVAFAFSFLFLIFNDFVHWGWHIHPDVLQTLFILLSVYSLVRIRGYWRSIVVSSLFLGLAFGTKYSGIFALLVPLGVVVLRSLDASAERGKSKVVGRILFSILLICAVFVAAWLLANPHVVENRSELIKDLLYEKGHISRGHNASSSTDGLLWLGVLVGESSIWAILLLALGSFATVFVLSRAAYRRARDDVARVESKMDRGQGFVFVLLIYCVAAIAYLFFSVNMRAPRFLFHVWPAIVVVSAWGTSKLLMNYGGGGRFVGAALSVLVLVVCVPIYGKALRQLGDEVDGKQHSQYIDAGRWMEDHYDPNTKILAGFYSYVPKDRFRRGIVSYVVDLKMIERIKPDVIVYNKDIPGRFIWKKEGTALADREFVERKMDKSESHQKAMAYLLSEESEYQIVYEKPDIMIFEKKNSNRRLP